MKVKIAFTVDIDPDTWTMNYGIEGASEIREDVKEFAKNAVIDQFGAIGVLL